MEDLRSEKNFTPNNNPCQNEYLQRINCINDIIKHLYILIEEYIHLQIPFNSSLINLAILMEFFFNDMA